MSKQTGFEIKTEERQSWGSIAMVWIGSMICVPALMIGGMMGSGLSLAACAAAIIIGYVMICVFMCFMGMQGCDIVERKHLAKVGLIRIGAPATTGIPPMVDWPEDIQQVVEDYVVIRGGFEFDGREIARLDVDAAAAFFEKMKGKVASIAISCVFSTVRDDEEQEIAALCKKVMGEGVHVSVSSEIGSMGLIERENATILNAALYQVAQRFTEGFARSLEAEGITNAAIYLSQNDGTLMTMEYARKYPILTIACGPTNSIRGASYLSQMKDAVVIDVGGTTTDLGVIQNGFPRESSVAATIGGVRTNFRMPDIISIGLGGGSIVRKRDNGTVTVGPDSVGYEITSKALVFGGDVVTATDIAVRLGMTDLGDPKLAEGIDLAFARQAMAVISAMVEDSIDSMKISNADVDVVLVGGGSIILPKTLHGAATVLNPEHSGCANAIGSAISKVSGTFEKLIDYAVISRDQALEESKAEAVKLAVAAGAIADTVEIIEVEDVPLAYCVGQTNRVRVKAAGDLA